MFAEILGKIAKFWGELSEEPLLFSGFFDCEFVQENICCDETEN